MKITPLEIRGYQFKKGFKGYDIQEVEKLKELASDTLEEAIRATAVLDEKLKEMNERLAEHIANEKTLKDAITTAHSMVEDLKNNAIKEAQLLITEAKLQAEEIIRQAQSRSRELQDEIFRLRKQRAEIESSIKAILDYHSSILTIEGDESRKADNESEKLKFLPK